MLKNPRIGLDTAREKIILSLAIKPGTIWASKVKTAD